MKCDICNNQITGLQSEILATTENLQFLKTLIPKANARETYTVDENCYRTRWLVPLVRLGTSFEPASKTRERIKEKKEKKNEVSNKP